MSGFTLMQRLRVLRGAHAVKRYHTRRTLKENTVAEHSFGVATLGILVFGAEFGPALIRAALFHDIAEAEFGDIPSPAKRAMSPNCSVDLQQAEDAFMRRNDFFTLLSDKERHLLKFVDNLEGMIFCAEERAAGNKTLDEVWHTYLQYAGERCSLIEDSGHHADASEAIKLAVTLWENAA